MTDRVKTSFRLPKELHRKALEKCEREDITLSQVLRRLLRQWLAEDEQASKKKGETSE
jgi:hypothetical protein